MKNTRKFLPFLLSLVIVFFDQISKRWVINNIPVNTIYRTLGNDLVYICHVRNTGAAFSMGASSSVFSRILFFIIVPLALMTFISYCIVSTKKNMFTDAQKWFLAGILGGGLGTICDRIFRFGEGVVDFISVKFYGIFGLDRWPTFNVSDSCVVVFVILFSISVLFQKDSSNKRTRK